MYGKEIIEMLKEQNIHMDKKVENTINLIAFEIFTKGKEEGRKEGINVGMDRACIEFEEKISLIRNRLE